MFTYWPFARRLVLKGGLPLQLVFFVTARCNANCRHCFYRSHLNASGRELSLSEIEAVARGLPALLWLSLTGGEPFLRDDLPAVAALFYRYSHVRILTLPTNGLLSSRIVSQTRQIVHACPQTHVIVSVSVDGFPETHDRIRQVPGGYERARETFAGLKRLKEEYGNLSVIVTITFSALNQEELADLYCFLRDDWQPDNIGIGLVRGAIRDEVSRDLDLRYYRQANDLYRRDVCSGALPYYRSPLRRLLGARELRVRELVARTFEESRALLPCYAGRLSAVLSETGEVFPCEVLGPQSGLDIREYEFSFSRLWSSPQARQLTATIRRGCFCTYECAMSSNVLFNLRQYPALLHRMWRMARS